VLLHKIEKSSKGRGSINCFHDCSRQILKTSLKAQQIERALQYSLDEVERQIIVEKYLSTSRVKDINIYLDLGMTKDQYYPKKKDAIFQIAKALGII